MAADPENRANKLADSARVLADPKFRVVALHLRLPVADKSVGRAKVRADPKSLAVEREEREEL
jgi:hypothetical protein